MNFFQQLIDLADEPSAAAQADVDELGEDVGDLQESLRRTLTALGERATQYKHLEAEAETLRAEYDAYREKAEAAQNQLQERLREERLMMEELHRTRGSTDEVYARTSEEKIANLERKLDEGANELERATRRYAEAELGREAAEKAKKEEIDAITRRYDGFKEKSKQRQARLEEQLVQVQNDLQVLQAQVASAEAAKVLTELHKISVGEKDEEERDAAPVDEEAGDGGPVCSASASLGDVASATEVRRLQELLVEADRAASEAARRFSERERDLARQVESAEDDVMDLQKKLSESTASADHLRTELSRLQMSVSKAEDRRVGKEQDVLRQVQQLETLTASLKSELSQGQQQLVEVKQKYERELHDCKSKLLASSSSVEESEAHLRQEKERLEALVAEKEAECTELLTLKQTVEATAAASQEDAQTYMRMAADLRSELQRQANTMSEMEEHHLCSQRILSQREDEAQMKEGDRHDLLHQLREKEEQLHDARTKMEEMEVRLMAVAEVAVGADDDALTKAQDALREAQQQINELSETLACKDAQLSMARGKSEQMRRVHQQEIHARDARINELQHQRRTDQPKRTADPADSDPFDRALDEWSETQQTMPTNQRFIRDAIHSAKQLRSGRVSRQVTYIVVGVFSLLVVFMLISGMLTSPVSQSTAMATITEKLMDCQSQLTAATQAQRQTTTSAHG